MIVTVTLPPGKVAVSYGLIGLGVNNDGTVEIPQYVAKSLIAAGCSGDPCPSSIPTYINGGPDWEAIYMLQAYGQPITGGKSAAVDIFNARGEPGVSIS